MLTLKIKTQCVAGARANKVPWCVNRGIRYKSREIMLLCCKAPVRLQVEYWVPCWTGKWNKKNTTNPNRLFWSLEGRKRAKTYLRIRMFVLWERIWTQCVLSLTRHEVQEELITVGKCFLGPCCDLGGRNMQNAAELWCEQLWWPCVYCKFMMCIKREFLLSTPRRHLINTSWSDCSRQCWHLKAKISYCCWFQ